VCLAVGAAISVAAIQQFELGYILFLVAGAGMIGHWCVSEPIEERRRYRDLMRGHKYTERQQRAEGSYKAHLFAGLAVIVIVTAGCLRWTFDSQLQYERDSVLTNLEVRYEAPNGDVLNSIFSVKNGSNFDISDRSHVWSSLW
jgi:hypothetical protein